MRALSVGLGWIVPTVVAWAGTPAPPVDFSAAAEDSIRGVVRSESERMLQVMRGRDADSVLAFYGRHTAYVGNGEIGNWDAIVAGTKPRYATYTKVECRWDEGFRVDIRAPGSAVVTAMLRCARTSVRAVFSAQLLPLVSALAHRNIAVTTAEPGAGISTRKSSSHRHSTFV